MNTSTTDSIYAKKNVLANAKHFILGRGLAGLAGFFIVILIARYMDIKSYAGLTVLTGLVSFAGILSSLGTERVVSRYVPEVRIKFSTNKLSELIWKLTLFRLATSSAICILFYFSWPLLISLLKDVELVYFPIPLAIFMIAEALFQHFSSILQSLMQQKMLTRILFIQWGGRLLMIVLALKSDHLITLLEALWMMAIPEMLGIVAFVTVLSWYLKELATLPEQQAKDDETELDWKSMRQMGIYNYGFTLVAAPPQSYFVKIITGIFLPTQMVAAYGFFSSIAEKARQYIPLHFFYSLIEPVLVGRYVEDEDFNRLKRYCQSLYKTNLMLLTPAIVWVAVADKHLLNILSSGKYSQFGWVLLLVIVQLTIGSHVVLLQLILNAIEKSKLLINAAIFALAGMLIFWLIVISTKPVLLVAGPIIFSLICNVYVIHYLNRQGYEYGLTWQVFTGVLVAGIFTFVIGVLTKQVLFPNVSDDTLVTGIAGIVIFSIYTFFVILLKLITQEEKSFLSMLVNSK